MKKYKRIEREREIEKNGIIFDIIKLLSTTFFSFELYAVWLHFYDFFLKLEMSSFSSRIIAEILKLQNSDTSKIWHISMKSINFLLYIFAQSIELQVNHFGRDQFVLKPGIEHMLVILNLSKNHMMKTNTS